MPDPTPAEPPVWTPAARWTLAGLVALTLGLASWHAAGRTPWAADPMPLKKGVVPLAPIDLNSAGEDRLAAIPGIGPALARRILDHRADYGQFPSVDALRLVRGIGPATLERIRPFLVVEDPEEAAPAPAPARFVRGARPDGVKVNINAASAEDLQTLPGIGPVLSSRIIEARAKGRFSSVDDLRKVKGIGPKTLEKLRPHAEVGP